MRSTYQKQFLPNYNFSSSTQGSSLFDFYQAPVSSTVTSSSSHIPVNTYGQYGLYKEYEHTSPENTLPQNSKPVLPYQNIAINPIVEEDESPLNLILNWDFNRRQFDGWLARSASFDSLDTQFGAPFVNKAKKCSDNNSNPPPGFFNPASSYKDSKYGLKRKWSNASTDTEFNPFKQNNLEVSRSPQNLYSIPCPNYRSDQPCPKKKSLEKREYRGQFEIESVTNSKFTGTLKFYQTKNKRYGFITLDEDGTDVFLCEDDLILSGINYKNFKENVASKTPMKFTFNIKHYIENGKTKRKAVDLNLTYI